MIALDRTRLTDLPTCAVFCLRSYLARLFLLLLFLLLLLRSDATDEPCDVHA